MNVTSYAGGDLHKKEILPEKTHLEASEAREGGGKKENQGEICKERSQEG